MKKTNDAFPDKEHQATIIQAHLDPELDGLLEQHHKDRFEWFPSEHLPCSHNMTSSQEEELHDFKQQCQQLPDSMRVAMVLNLLTEEGLPSYHRLLHEAFGENSDWCVWANQWTAEEDRHGNILRDIIRDTRLVDFTAVEKMQFDFVADGFAPDWSGDAYATIAYTSFQERATQISHRNLGKIIRPHAPRLTKVFACIAGDESRHYKFYASMLKTLVDVDVKGALESMLRVLGSFKMPGHNIAGFSEMSLVEHSLNIFGPKEFSEAINDVIKFTGLDKLTHLDTYCEELRQKVYAYPTRLLRFHEKLYNRVKEKASKLKFDFLDSNGNGLLT